MRMWLAKKKNYARFSLRTRNRDTAEAKAKKYYHELMAQQLAGKTYFSMTSKQGVEEYVKHLALKFICQLLLLCFNLINAAHSLATCVVGWLLKKNV